MKAKHETCVLTIAGTDPTAGAGVQADMKAITATGSYAATVITALVAQNTQGVQAIQDVSAAFVTSQLDSVFSDLTISAVKIGMIHTVEVMEAVALAIEKYRPANIVLDPVMVAKNGCELLPSSLVHYLKERLIPLTHLITPNLHEAEKLLREKIETPAQMEAAAMRMAEMFNTTVLVKGGHLNTRLSSDVLYSKHSPCHWFHEERIDTKNTHGTGCTLSSAIASYLAQGEAMPDAIQHAKRYLTKAIQSGSQLHIGHGCGPVDHFYMLKEKAYAAVSHA